MSNFNTYKTILESRENKFCIYFENLAIYCKSIDSNGKINEMILVDNVYSNYLCTKSSEDNIYLLCQGRNRNFLLFVYDGQGWHMEELNLRKTFGNIIPLSLNILADSINIICAKKLSVEDYYDVFQLKKAEDDWQKTFVCEIYSKTPSISIDINMTGYDMLHMVSALFDGQISSLYYHNYSVKSNEWLSIPLVNLNYNYVHLKTLVHQNKLDIFCYSIENNTLNLFYFSKYLNKDFNFSLIDIIKLSPLPSDLDLVIEVHDGILKICYIDMYYYWENHYSISQKKWVKTIKISLNEFPNLHYAIIINDNINIDIEQRKSICSISDKLEVLLPEMKSDSNKESDNEVECLNPNAVKLILKQIDFLSEKIEDLNKKLNKMKDKEYNNDVIPIKEIQCQNFYKSNPPALRESNFRERFMNSKPSYIKINSSTLLSGEVNNTKTIFSEPTGMMKEDMQTIFDRGKDTFDMVDNNQKDKSKSIIKSLIGLFK